MTAANDPLSHVTRENRASVLASLQAEIARRRRELAILHVALARNIEWASRLLLEDLQDREFHAACVARGRMTPEQRRAQSDRLTRELSQKDEP